MKLDTIKKRADFLAANNAGKFITPSVILQMRLRPEDHPAPPAPRIGYTVTRKMGGAVVRNRIKRRLRAAVAELSAELFKPGHDYVLISRQKALTCDFSELKRELQFAFSRITATKKPL